MCIRNFCTSLIKPYQIRFPIDPAVDRATLNNIFSIQPFKFIVHNHNPKHLLHNTRSFHDIKQPINMATLTRSLQTNNTHHKRVSIIAPSY